MTDKLREALRVHRVYPTDLVGWFGRCGCQKRDEMPVDFETIDEWIDHVFERAALAGEASVGAGEACIVCGNPATRQYEDSWYCETCWRGEGRSSRPRTPEQEIIYQSGRLLGLTEGMHKCNELLAERALGATSKEGTK